MKNTYATMTIRYKNNITLLETFDFLGAIMFSPSSTGCKQEIEAKRDPISRRCDVNKRDAIDRSQASTNEEA